MDMKYSYLQIFHRHDLCKHNHAPKIIQLNKDLYPIGQIYLHDHRFQYQTLLYHESRTDLNIVDDAIITALYWNNKLLD